MLNRFREYLEGSGTVKEKSIPYYCRWVGNAYSHCRVDLAQPLTTGLKSDFLADMAKSHAVEFREHNTYFSFSQRNSK